MNHPGEVVRIGGPKPEILSPANKVLLSQISLPRPESVTVPIEGGTMQMWILKPPVLMKRKMAFGIFGSRRSSGRMGRWVELSLESPDVGGPGGMWLPPPILGDQLALAKSFVMKYPEIGAESVMTT